MGRFDCRYISNTYNILLSLFLHCIAIQDLPFVSTILQLDLGTVLTEGVVIFFIIKI